MSNRGRVALVCAVLLVGLATVAVFRPVLEARALSFDDAEYVTLNRSVANPGWASVTRFFTEVTRPATFAAYYHPLSMTLLMLGHAAGGRAEDPTAFHVVSLGLHAANAALVMWLVFRLFGALVPAVLAALLYALHPLTVEPVAWVGEQKALLAPCFALASIALYVEGARGRGAAWTRLAWAAFALALLAKPTVTTLPLLLVLLDIWPLRRFGAAAFREKWPFLLLALVSGVVTVVSQQRVGGLLHPEPADLTTWPLRVAYVLAFYLRKLVWPFPLSSAYPQPEPLSLANPVVAGSVALLAALSAGLMALRRRFPGGLAAWALVLIAIAPTLSPVKFTWAIAFDHYFYLPAALLAIVLGGVLAGIWARTSAAGIVPRATLVLGAVAVLATQAAGVRAAIRAWADSTTLFRHMESVAPGSPAVHNQLGILASRRGAQAEAVGHLRRAIGLEPGYGAAHYNLGIALAATGDLAGALAEFESATGLLPHDADAFHNLGVALRLAHRPAEAIEPLRRAVALDPSHSAARTHLAGALAEAGDFRAAIPEFRAAIERSPSDATLHYQLASALVHSGAPARAVVEALDQAIRRRPGWAVPVNDLAWLRATSGDSAMRDPQEAVRLARLAMDLGGARDPRLIDTYAAALAAGGDFGGAADASRRAIRLADSAGATALGTALRSRLALYRRGLPYRDPPAR